MDSIIRGKLYMRQSWIFKLRVYTKPGLAPGAV